VLGALKYTGTVTQENTTMPHPLTRIRESLGFDLGEVAAYCTWPPAKLREIERSEDIDDGDAARLSDAYGVDVVRVLDGIAAEMPAPTIRGLLKAQAEALDAHSRFAISEAAATANDAAVLKKALGEPVGWVKLSQRFKHDPDYGHPRDGAPAMLARKVRGALRLAADPVPSMLEVVSRLGIHVIVADLVDHVDAVSFAMPTTGGVIILNSSGSRAKSAFGRRVTIAHELCHVLFDRPKMRKFQEFCWHTRPTAEDAKRLETFDAIERRARAFAVYFLAPLEVFQESWGQLESLPDHARVRLLMERFGIGYEAVRGHLDTAGLYPVRKHMTLVETETPPAWEERDPLPVHRAQALACVPLHRRGQFLQLVERAWQRGVLSESGARDALRVQLGDWPSVKAYLVARSRPWSNANEWRTSSAVVGLPPA